MCKFLIIIIFLYYQIIQNKELMKTKLPFTILIFFFLFINVNAQTVTSVTDGNWTNPLTWGGTVPIPGNTIIINHNVLLDIDFGYTSGSILVNSGASLTGNSAARGLAVNYPSGNGSLTVNGTLDVARVSLFGGVFSLSGTLQSDSLFNLTTINIGNSANLNTSQFFNGTGGLVTNYGTITTTNLLNMELVINNGTIHSDDFHNCKTTNNNTGAVITLNHDFLNADSIVYPAIFVNDGRQEVMNDWQNQDSIKGSGKFCIVNNTNNSGIMTGTFDFCDMSGGNIDLNTGTIDITITYCTYPCTPGISPEATSPVITAAPNPSGGLFIIKSDRLFSKIEISSLLGQVVYSKQLESETAEIDISTQTGGIYFYKIFSDNQVIRSGKIMLAK